MVHILDVMVHTVYQVVRLACIVCITSKSLILLNPKLLLTRFSINQIIGNFARTLNLFLLSPQHLFLQAHIVLLLPVGRELTGLNLHFMNSNLLGVILTLKKLHFEKLHV